MLKDRSHMPWQDINLKFFAKGNNFIFLLEAIECAKGWMEFMKRKDGRDEFVHAERTAQIYLYHVLRNESKESILMENLEVALIVCLFHDLVENINPKIFEYIRVHYGKDIAEKVGILTIGKGDAPEIYFPRVYDGLLTGLVKNSDRLHNLRNMTFNLGVSDFFSESRLLGQINETKKFIMKLNTKLLRKYPLHRNLIEEMRKELLYSLRDAEYLLGVHI